MPVETACAAIEGMVGRGDLCWDEGWFWGEIVLRATDFIEPIRAAQEGLHRVGVEVLTGLGSNDLDGCGVRTRLGVSAAGGDRVIGVH